MQQGHGDIGVPEPLPSSLQVTRLVEGTLRMPWVQDIQVILDPHDQYTTHSLWIPRLRVLRAFMIA